MEERAKYFLSHLPACLIFALAAGLGALMYHTGSNHIIYPTAVKVYSVGWFAASILSFYCGLLVVPRSLGIIFSFAGVVAFAILCAMDTGTLAKYAIFKQTVQALPAMFFLAAWAAVAITACKSESKKIRLSSWFWLAIFLVLLSSWGSFHLAERRLFNERNEYLIKAREKTLTLVADLTAYKEANGAYPQTLDEAGIDPEKTRLSLTGKQIKYSFHDSQFALSFADPVPCGQTAMYSYDTDQGGWFGTDPEDAIVDSPCHMFLGFLRQR